MSLTPSIRVSHHPRHRSPPARPSLATGAGPMAIPSARPPVPPPLPPPTYIPEISTGQDPGWQWGNDPNNHDFGRAASVKAGSSLLGATGHFARAGKGLDHTMHTSMWDSRRGSSLSTVTDGREHDMEDEEGTHSSRPTSNYGLQSERQLEQWTLEESSQTYDKQLLSRIGGPNAPRHQSASYASSGLAEKGQVGGSGLERRHSSLRPLAVPERRHASVELASSARWPSSGAVSPTFSGFWAEHGAPEYSRSVAAGQGGAGALEEGGSQRGSYDSSMFLHHDFAMEEGPMSGLHIHDRGPGSPHAGSKRRASSPPREREDRSSVSSASGQSEIYTRRSMMQQLPSSVSRFHPNHASLSSTSSGVGPHHGSLGSSLGLVSVPSSATSYGSGRLSPTSALSPAADADLRISAPYASTQTSTSSPILAHHQRALSEHTQPSARKLSPTDSMLPHSRHGSLPHMHGVYICECCPKKPKKFDTEAELRSHESEKQYTCAYCPNRFKNKNEAERHQNSLHLRRHSWSCAALVGIEAAFHGSPSSSGTDICGYCGEEFANPPQWDIRAEHLNHVHKFGECNQAKKFFRADHFRQHLKHSHAGTSGKWTNVLENVCMKDEPLPEKRVSPGTVAGPGIQPAPTLMVSTSGLPGIAPHGGTPLAHGTVEETPHDT